jgi:outer membrane receptor protein involved in Fe transport
MEYKLSDTLTLTSITGYNRAYGTSEEDYNRIVPVDPFTPGDGILGAGLPSFFFPNGVVNDPQIGRTNKTATFDYGTATSKEYTEELRLSSSFSGPVNFSAGAVYSELTEPFGGENYYVFSNALTAPALLNNAVGGAIFGPLYIDPSSIPTGAGHNYYDARSGGGFLKTYAAFGELYWQIAPTLRLTVGGRFNVDQLYNNSFPIELYVPTPNGTTPMAGADGTVAFAGFPPTVCTTSATECVIPQKVTYRKVTGRVNLDWTPTLSFTDKTMFYASYSRGYKGGGFNTPCQTAIGQGGNIANSCPYPLNYAPEAINAYEIGTKNTLMGGHLLLNLDGFYYDYTGYQISTIVAKSSVNLNINAKIYGVEFESTYSPIANLTFNANVGYLHTRIDDGQALVNTLDLTQGNPAYTLVHGLDGTACLGPTAAAEAYIAGGFPAYGISSICAPPGATNPFSPFWAGLDPNNANGLAENIGGKNMPNSPHWTISAGAQYVFDLPSEWTMTPRVDWYWQDSSYARVFNDVNDFLQPYHVVNATLTFARTSSGLQIQAWVKNVFNAQPITGVYLTNDTSGLFQNVFTLDPRTYGVQVTKRF